MGIVRDLYYARKMSAGLKLPAPTVALLIKRLRLAAAMGGDVTKTVSGSPAHITDALAKAALSVVVSIEPIQDLHGYSSPWPAGGGKNKITFPYYSGSSTTINGVTFTVDDNGVITANGLASADAEFILMQQGTTVNLSAGDWTISGLPNGGGSSSFVWNVYGHDPDNTVVFDRRTGGTSYTFNCPNGLKDLYIGLRIISGYNCQNLKVYPQFESGSSPTTFAPYANICPISGLTGLSVYVSPTQDPDDATVYNVDWSTQAGTVYGCTLDVVTGELVVDRGCVNVSPSWYWYKSSSYPGGFYATIDNAGTGQKENTPFICSHAKTATVISQYVKGTCFCDGSINIRIMDGSNTVQDWKDYINAQSAAGTPIQICYELATPLTYQLTPQEVQMLLGENYVWSSSGDTVSVTYYAEGNANTLQSLNILLGGRYSNPKTADDVSDKEALEIILGGNK